MVTDPVERRLNGSLLRDIRKVRRLGQIDVARTLDISTGKVSQVENGDADYQTAELQAFARLTGVDFVDLLCWMGFAADRASQSYRDWYRAAHATGEVGIHAPRSSVERAADAALETSTTRANKRVYSAPHMIMTSPPRYAFPVG